MKPHTELLLKRLPEGEVTGAEIGTFRGINATAILRARSDVTLYLVDPWHAYPPDHRYSQQGGPFPNKKPIRKNILNQEWWDKTFDRVVEKMKQFGNRATIVRAESKAAAQVVIDGLDFVFIDGDHSYEGCKEDIEAWLPKIKPGGLLAGHDYGKPEFGVTKAVDELLGDAITTAAVGRNCSWYHTVPEEGADAEEQPSGKVEESLAASGQVEEVGDQDSPVEDGPVVQDGSQVEE